MKTNYPKISYNTIKRNENKAFWSKKKKIKSFIIGTDRVRRILDESTLGIVNIVKIRQRLKDIELHRGLSEISNDTRKLANQSNKMRTYRLFKTIDNYKCEDYLHRVTHTRHRITLTKTATRPPQIKDPFVFFFIYLVRILYPVRSPQSAVRSPQSIFYTDRLFNCRVPVEPMKTDRITRVRKLDNIV